MIKFLVYGLGIIAIVTSYFLVLKHLRSTIGWYKTDAQRLISDLKAIILPLSDGIDIEESKPIFQLMDEIDSQLRRWVVRVQDFPANDDGNFLKLEDNITLVKNLIDDNRQKIWSCNLGNMVDRIFLVEIATKVKQHLEKIHEALSYFVQKGNQ